METDGYWTCDATKLECEMTDKMWDEIAEADSTGKSDEQIALENQLIVALINQMYGLACGDVLDISWDLKKKELKKRTQEWDDC